MRPKLLKKALGRYRWATEVSLGISVGIMVGRKVVDVAASRVEREAARQEAGGFVTPELIRKRKVLRAVRGILHIL